MEWMLISLKWMSILNKWSVCSLRIKRYGSFSQHPLIISFITKLQCVPVSKLRAWKTSRGNKDLAHRTFQEAKRVWKDHSCTYINEDWHAPKRNYVLGNPLPHIPKFTFKSIFRYSSTSMSCNEGKLFKLRMFLRHWLKLIGEYVDQTLIGFLYDYTWSSQLKTIAHCLLLNCTKQGILLQNIISCSCVAWMYLFFLT